MAAAAFLFCSPAASDVGTYLKLEKASQVVKLTPPTNFTTGGTGFQVKGPSGRVYTLTNAHICALAANGTLAAHVPNQKRITLIRVIEVRPEMDLCLLTSMPAASGLSVADSFREAEHLYVLGHPFLKPLTLSDGYTVSREFLEMPVDVEPTDCVGPMMQMREVRGFFGMEPACVQRFDAWDTTITVYPGNSGSPVFNTQGEVVGVVFATDQRTFRGAFIPLESVKEILRVY